MTFGQARTILRNDILAELSTEFYGEEELLRYLVESAGELAAAFQFPTVVATVSVAAGATTFTVASDARALVLNQVVYNGYPLLLRPLASLLQFAGTESMKRPRFYSYDSRRGNTVTFAPAAPAGGGVFTYEYVESYPLAIVEADDAIWDGLYPEYHFLVTQGAAARAFDASLESERAQYWIARQNSKTSEFAQVLNRRPLNELAGGDPHRRVEDRVTIPDGGTQ